MKRLRDEELLKLFGERLRSARQNKGWSQEEFEEEVGIDRSRLARIERGEVNITLSTANMLADAVNIPLEEFISEKK